MKRQASDLEKILADHISGRGLISRIYRELSKCNSKKQTIQFKNGKKTRTVISEDIQMANKYMKGCSTLLTIKEKQIKTTLRASGWVEGRALISSYKSSKITTSCWTTIDRRMLEPIQKKITPCPTTQKKPQQDGRRGTIMIKSSPIPSRWVTHKLENHNTKAKLSCYPNYLLTFYFCIQIPNDK